ncbi:MAG: 16S rRNA (uracil(1498)-N(3))-methyltransferase [Clostridia bacterium]|nr:16S rRNA (uracil(1498)-N(3))-methyltransferase [Clostridia bacterium]
MPKFFVPKENISENEIIITGQDVSHISRVLRMKKGEELLLCDGRGNDYIAVIGDIMQDKISCNILECLKSDTEANVRVTLFQGIPKASKMDYIIQKTTELGIDKIIPCAMDRCVARLDDKDAQKKQQRWQKLCEEAAKQSGRGVIPEVGMPVSFKQAIELMKDYDLCFAPYECEEENCIRDTLLSKENVRTVAYMIGPEGGYSLEEKEYLSKSGITTVTLGKRILRTETAGEAVLSMIMYEIGDVNCPCLRKGEKSNVE